MLVRRMFSRRWLLATLLVLAGAAVCIRLGIWQLDRLEQRRAFNTRVSAQLEQAPLELTPAAVAALTDADLYNQEYRQVVVQGTYDHSQEVAIQNQAWENQWGVHLLTPLVISGTQQAILVDRGWIPAADFAAGDWQAYQEPGIVTVSGILRRPQTKAEIGNRSDPTPAPGEGPRKSWYFVNIAQISRQVSTPLLGAYIQQAPQPTHTGLPYRALAKVEISEGPHMGYALQWFTFAALLLIGYPFFIRRQEKRPAATRKSSGGAAQPPTASGGSQ